MLVCKPPNGRGVVVVERSPPPPPVTEPCFRTLSMWKTCLTNKPRTVLSKNFIFAALEGWPMACTQTYKRSTSLLVQGDGLSLQLVAQHASGLGFSRSIGAFLKKTLNRTIAVRKRRSNQYLHRNPKKTHPAIHVGVPSTRPLWVAGCSGLECSGQCLRKRLRCRAADQETFPCQPACQETAGSWRCKSLVATSAQN